MDVKPLDYHGPSSGGAGAHAENPAASTRFSGRKLRTSVTMQARDGVTLTMDLIGPDTDEPLPVVLVRTPYDKVSALNSSEGSGIPYDPSFIDALVDRGYIYAVQDVRGRFNSDGVWSIYRNEMHDGFDAVEWVADQPWCDGKVGMIGRSYVGWTQWQAAAHRPRGLTAIVPIAAQPDLFDSGFPFFNGIFSLSLAELVVTMGRHAYQVSNFMGTALREAQQWMDHLPVATMPEAAGTSTPSWWAEMMQHPNRDDFWRQVAYADALQDFDLPVLNISGWYDLTRHGAIVNHARVADAGTPFAREHQRLVLGPWAHWAGVSASTERIDFGPAAHDGISEYVLRFFDRWLKGIEGDFDAEQRVQLFLFGANRWVSSPTWPLQDAVETPLYLHAGGRLEWSAPEASLPSTYTYDPADPVRAPISMHDGPVDDSFLDDRADVLIFTTPPLEHDLDVVGPLRARLHVSSSAVDADWHVRLVDLHPDGFAQYLVSGAIRSRFRDSFEHPRLLEPGEPVGIDVDLYGVANRFLAGHRLRLEITSSWFPRFERNLNTGAPNNLLETEAVIAEQRVFHDPQRTSVLMLPIVAI
jgi:putative CocE/NonD family hydrolase